MKKVLEYSHLGGAEILEVRYPEIDREIDQVIEGIKDVQLLKVSKEKTKTGYLLYSPADLYERFRKGLREHDFIELRETYTIKLPEHDTEVSGAYKSVDFSKGRVLVEVQFGKYAFMFYDMAKFQFFYNENKADVGVEIVPSHSMHKKMSSGVAYGEQLVFDINRLRRHFPMVPVKIILIDVDDAAKENLLF